jgi:hypothetical protein
MIALIKNNMVRAFLVVSMILSIGVVQADSRKGSTGENSS